ncbi:PQQ-dependent sugar dehydrogenase [Gordonia polyisoprenivorans]|uniref:PQQ-dependent sugar dehydrogenase n=1 Tax=Gordonia polyisoprenivorans TaxID=84595 RepID=UPI001E561B59|nr:PQQ-dependent sugar dehydrogenase [Gordonia polyisoprenivorans]
MSRTLRSSWLGRVFTSMVCLGAVVVGSGVVAGEARPEPAPDLAVETVTGGLRIPWEVVAAPDGTILTNERSGRFVAVAPDGRAHTVRADLSTLFVTGEAGLMGMALDPGFATNRRLYTCQSEVTAPTGRITAPPSLIRSPLPWPNTGQVNSVVAWRVAPDWSALTRERTVLSGIPLTMAGREAGCGVTAAPDGTLWIGTGDTGLPTVSQDRSSLGGKVLHINADGSPAAGNPDAASPIFTLGHRNVQNIALGPAGRVYSIEQGTHVDDELNLLTAGGNYGFRPDKRIPLNDEDAVMTDARVPGAIGPVWKSGAPTVAPPAITFLPDSGWGQWNGALVISALKGKRLILVQLSDDGRRVERTADALDGEYGRLRGTTIAADGSLLLLTNNGTDDKILRVRPS